MSEFNKHEFNPTRCAECRGWIEDGERSLKCSNPACSRLEWCLRCDDQLAECECGALICTEHRYEVSGLILCAGCARLELDAMEKEAA